MKRRVTTILASVALLLVASVVAVVAGVAVRESRSGGNPQVGAPTAADPTRAAPTYSSGTPAWASLPADSNAVAGGISGSTLSVVGYAPGATALMLYDFDTTATSPQPKATALPLPAGSILLGFAIDSSGTRWIGENAVLVRVPPGGTPQSYAIPQPMSMLTPPFSGPSGPSGLPPTDTGQVSAIAILDGKVALGRRGAPEITMFDPATSAFSHVSLGPGVGDVATLTSPDPHTLFFTVNRSGKTPNMGNDIVGVFDATTGKTLALPFAARTLSSASGHVAVAGFGLGLFDQSGSLLRAPAGTAAFDESRVALLANDVTAVRIAGNSHEVAFVGPNGAELRRVEYAAVIGRDAANRAAPYSSTFSFVVSDGSGALWFGLVGRPEIYRLS